MEFHPNFMPFNLISTVLFVALNKEGVKNVFHLHWRQYKIDTAPVYKVSLVFQLGRNSHSEKIKVASIELPLKQTLCLGNH